MKRFIFALVMLVFAACGEARAVHVTITSDTGLLSPPYNADSGTPPGLCAGITAAYNWTFWLSSGGSNACMWGSNAGTVTLCMVYHNVNGCIHHVGVGGVGTISSVTGCWATWASTNHAYTNTPPAGCDICPSPEEWNSSTHACEMPDCDSGEIWDDDIDACRAECSGSNFYHYTSSSCKPQCPVGDTSKYRVITNKPLPLLLSEGPPAMQGCSVETHFWKLQDVKVPPANEGYWSGAEYTGEIYFYWWTYDAEIPVTLVSQAEWEAATGGAGYYTGEDVEERTGFNETAVALDANQSDLSAAAVLVAMHAICEGGLKSVKVSVSGGADETVYLGPCVEPDQEFTSPAPSTDAVQARVEQKVDDIKNKQDTDSGVLAAVKNLGDEIKEGLQSLRTAMAMEGEGEGGGVDPGCVGEACGIDGGSYGDPAESSDLYERQHPGGLGDVTEDVPDVEVGSSQFTGFFNDLQPTWPSEVPECLAWDFQVPTFSAEMLDVHMEPPCMVWDAMKLLLMGLTLAGAWSLIFVRGV